MEEKIKRMDRLAAIGQFAAGIAHEIRNPLTSLSGSIQVLKDETNLNDENRRLMDIALKETQRLNNLITDFLLFAQPERGVKKKINLSLLIEETLDIFIHSPECQENIQIFKSISPNLFIKGNSEHLKQVFWNILKNAAQAQPEGGFIHVKVQTENCPENSINNYSHLRAKVIVKDGGCGIPKNVQKKIFDPFFTTREFGSGLGLAITYRIIESHQGEINVISQENAGTEMIIYLPLISNKS
jgi:two-component system sensor histidine kinase PilS (NtrC family)